MPLRDDFRFALRTLRKSPSFTATAVLAPAAGIGANIAIFSLVDALLIRPLPMKDSSRLVEVWEDASFMSFPQDTPAPLPRRHASGSKLAPPKKVEYTIFPLAANFSSTTTSRRVPRSDVAPSNWRVAARI